MSATGSSPIKNGTSSYSPHIRSELEKAISSKVSCINLKEFWKMLGYDVSEFTEANQHLKSAGLKDMKPMTGFQVYADKVSDLVRDKWYSESSKIQFVEEPNLRPKDHPTASTCRPDLIVTTMTTIKDVHWTGIEATVEVHSSGRTVEGAGLQAASYATYLLQARPDRLAVQGFCATKLGVMLIITSGSGVHMTDVLDLKHVTHQQLFYAFIKRLYEPHSTMVDPTITRRWDPVAESWVFDINLTLAGGQRLLCHGYRIMYARESFGQRAHIFVNKDNPTLLNGVPIPVIKDAYCEEDTRFTEDVIIRHIHKDGAVPGVVHMVHAEVVRYENGEVIMWGSRRKTRVCLTTFGLPFMELKTPKEALIAIYDLLESTRVMHRNSNVLHRDISIGNIMFRESAAPAPHLDYVKLSPSPADVGATDGDSPPPADAMANEEKLDVPAVFCGAKYLLSETTDRGETSNILIDLERAEILSEKLNEQRLPRTGTYRFMARAIRTTHPLGDFEAEYSIKRVPELSDAVCNTYADIFPDRVKGFASEMPRHSVLVIARPSTIQTRHALRHDAESAFWVLVWWAVSAGPAVSDEPPTCIPIGVWDALTNQGKTEVRPLKLADDALDPAYAPLYPLLEDLAAALATDHHWATEAPYTHPEFFHEVFQRLILNFLVDNQTEEFMELAKAADSRKSEEHINTALLSHSRVESLRNSSTGSSLSTNSRKRTTDSFDLSDRAKKSQRSSDQRAESSHAIKTRSQSKK